MINQKGQTLLEVILAFGIVILVLGSISSVIVTSLNNTQYSKNQSLASSYAQEGINVIRNISDAGWNDLYQKELDSDKYCITDDLSNWVITSGNCTGSNAIGPNGIFSRQVMLDSSGCNPGGIHATVRVAWTDGKCSAAPYCHHVDLQSCFENYNLKSTP
jgi:type II secretory pathway pseudopilin PulG